jgi:putative thioredoxin
VSETTRNGTTSTSFDVDEAGFPSAVLERSHEVPVVVDFWASWCGPCRTLGPMLEAAVAARGGEVVLAKVDVDANPGLARSYRVQGIPQVVGIHAGRVVASFVGAVPQTQLEAFLDELVPTRADRLVAAARAAVTDDEATELLREAIGLDPAHREAAIGLAERLVSEDPDRALALVTPHRPDPAAEAVVTRVELARDGGDVDTLRAEVEQGQGTDASTLLALGRALAARGDHDEAIERLLAAVELGGEHRDAAREQLVALFGVLGDGDPRVTAARPRLARALF